MDFIHHNQEVYNRIASFFSGTRGYLWDDLKLFRSFAANDDTILDLGCGNGRLYQLFDGLSIRYIGFDQSRELLNLATQKVPQGEFAQGSMTELPFERDFFDVIFCIAVFHHLPTREDRIKALLEMKRVLKPGKKIVMTNWNLYSDGAKKRHPMFAPGDFMIPWKSPTGEVLGERYYHGFTDEELRGLFEEVGLSLVDQYYTRKGKKERPEVGANIVSVLKK